MKKIHIALMAAVFGIAGATSAYAHDSVGFSIHIGEPVYYSAPPVYYTPPPVYYPRPIVYYSPTPAYYEQYDPRGYFQHEEHRFRHYDDRHEWHHHRHDDDD